MYAPKCSQLKISSCSHKVSIVFISSERILKTLFFHNAILKQGCLCVSVCVLLAGSVHVPVKELRLVSGPSIAGPRLQMAACVSPHQPPHHVFYQTGSDQIWQEQHQLGMHFIFLSHAPDNGFKKIFFLIAGGNTRAHQSTLRGKPSNCEAFPRCV